MHRANAADADCLILTHGAGANCQSVLLTTLADAFFAAGRTVLRCDLPFRQARPHGPPSRGSSERDQAGLRAAVEAMRRNGAGKIYLGGHSSGGRQASMLAACEPGLVEGLLLRKRLLTQLGEPERHLRPGRQRLGVEREYRHRLDPRRARRWILQPAGRPRVLGPGEYRPWGAARLRWLPPRCAPRAQYRPARDRGPARPRRLAQGARIEALN